MIVVGIVIKSLSMELFYFTAFAKKRPANFTGETTCPRCHSTGDGGAIQ